MLQVHMHQVIKKIMKIQSKSKIETKFLHVVYFKHLQFADEHPNK